MHGRASLMESLVWSIPFLCGEKGEERRERMKEKRREKMKEEIKGCEDEREG